MYDQLVENKDNEWQSWFVPKTNGCLNQIILTNIFFIIGIYAFLQVFNIFFYARHCFTVAAIIWQVVELRIIYFVRDVFCQEGILFILESFKWFAPVVFVFEYPTVICSDLYLNHNQQVK